MKKFGFTLAETLITLSIIGVVTAITLPTVINHFNVKVWNSSSDIFEKKFEQALKVMNTQDKLSGNETTEEFVNQLSKQMKINKICQYDKILDCFNKQVFWGGEQIDLKNAKTSYNFGHEDWNTRINGLQLADGTMAMVVYNPSCKIDPYTGTGSVFECVSVLYDTSGFKRPNEQNKDLRGINLISLNGKSCVFKTDDNKCWSSGFKPIAETYSDITCDEFKEKYGIKDCCQNNGLCTSSEPDDWAGAVKTCKDQGLDLPSRDQLKLLAQKLYKNGKYDSELASFYGLPTPASGEYIYVLSNEEIRKGTDVGSQGFYIDHSESWPYGYRRTRNTGYAFCVEP